MLISRVTRSTSPLSLILSFSRILIATFSPVIVCVPILTLPNVPDPSERPELSDKKLDYWKDNLDWLTDNIVTYCPILGFFSSLLRTLSWLRNLLLLAIFFIGWEVSVSVRDSKVLVILNVLRPMTWVCSRCACSVLGSCRFLLYGLVLRLATWRWECATAWQIVLDRPIRGLWSVRCGSGLRNSQSSVVFCVTSWSNLVIRYLI